MAEAFALNVEKVLEHWTPAHALREVIANALDEHARRFTKRGYTRTTMRDIADEAGVSAQTVYDSVGSKRVLVGQLNDLIDTEAGIRELAAPIDAAENPRDGAWLTGSTTRVGGLAILRIAKSADGRTSDVVKGSGEQTGATALVGLDGFVVLSQTLRGPAATSMCRTRPLGSR